MSITRPRVTRLTIISAAVLLAIAASGAPGARAGQSTEPLMDTQGAASILSGPQRITPAAGNAGVTNGFAFRPYNLPGEFIDDAAGGVIEGETFFDARANSNQPIQTSDWWNGAGLQFQGWVVGNDAGNVVARTRAVISEPFQSQFVDLPAQQLVPGLDAPVHGVRMWNPSVLDVFTAYTDPAAVPTMIFGRGDIRGQKSPLVTVGLQGVHPIRPNDGDVPTARPWTNVRIQSYTDWGVTMSYADSGSELTMSMANGSPFTWLQRTQGTAPFRAWVGVDSDDPGGTSSVWYAQDGVLGVTVTNSYISPAPSNPVVASPAAYAIYTDQGTWSEQRATSVPMSLFSNDAATKVVVAALPHNIDLDDTAALTAALQDLEPYAWQRTVDTKIHYPPIDGSNTSVTVGGQSLPLGYDAANSVARSQMEVTTEDFKTGGAPGTAMQLVFPHHRAAMITADKANIPQANGVAKYTWKSVNGELQAYVGNGYVRELTTYGVLPFMPGVAYEGSDESAAEDVYDTLKTWYYQAEPNLGGTPGPFVRNIGTYFPFQNNTYAPNLAGIYENLVIADQLARSPLLSDVDTDLQKPKNAVAADIRNFVLASLKEVVGRWADPYTGGVFQYNSEFDTLYGQPEGYGSVQNLNDKHFHWGYFLRAAAAIGRYDNAWLQAYLPLFNEMIGDVATFDRSSTRYPFLRNFSPFYGHHWANGTANGGIGNDQESTSEAINFSVGLLELGELLDNSEWRDLGMYLYEEEILAVEQYWFNQDADLSTSSGTYWNGNWPDAFVRYQHNGMPFTSPFIGQLFQTFGTRGTFFGSSESPPFANSLLIQAVPLSASHLYVGRDPAWLEQAWAQYGREAQLDPRSTSYEVVLAGMQARLPLTGTLNDATPDTPGPFGALKRVDRPHVIYPAATNSMGENFAYAMAELGVVDAGVVADTASYGVFCRGGSLPGCVGGTRSYSAYNPSSAPLSVTFRDADTRAPVATLEVPALALMTQDDGGTVVTDMPTPSNVVADALTLAAVDGRRLYFGKPTSFPAACSDLPSQALPLATTPGTWMLPPGSTPYPSDTSALDDSIVCVPGRPDVQGTNVPADPPYVRSWQGTFSGELDSDAFTHFNIFTNQSLFPGWQLDPCVAGGDLVPSDCPSFGVTNQTGTAVGANAFTMQVSYDFDSDGTPDRQEQYRMMTLSIGNSWTYENKQTHDKFDQPWPFAAPPMIVGGRDGTKVAPFPASIPADKPGTIIVEMWGGTMCQNSPDCARASYPVPISVNADPVTNRASWIEPPYAEGLSTPPTTSTTTSPSTSSTPPSSTTPTSSAASTSSTTPATTGASTASTTTTQPSAVGTLPATGADPARRIAVAAAALLAGIGLVVTARPRRRR
jgi:hypothetical protein